MTLTLSYLLQVDWSAFAERWGFPVVVLVVLALFFWKALWPFLTERIEKTEAVLIKASETANTARTEALSNFLEALKEDRLLMKDLAEKYDQHTQEDREAFVKIQQALSDLTREIKGSGRSGR